MSGLWTDKKNKKIKQEYEPAVYLQFLAVGSKGHKGSSKKG